MTTLAEDAAAVSAIAAEIAADKGALIEKCKRVIPLTEALCQRIIAEAPDRASEVNPMMEGLRFEMAKLCGQLQ